MHSFCYLSNDKIALILEYGIGGTLADYLKSKGKLKEREARSIFHQLIKAIKYCHNKQVIHRDLKPENILFTDLQKTQIKIIDFGLAGLFNGEINKGGSLSYMAPEVVGGHYESNPEIDVWALGCILYEMLTGEKLFNEKIKERKEKILRGKVILDKVISPEAAHLINKMLKVKSSERISINDCFDHCWLNNKRLSDNEIKEHESMLNSLNTTTNETNSTANNSKRNSDKSIKEQKVKEKEKENEYMPTSSSQNNEFDFHKYLRSSKVKTITNNKNELLKSTGMISKVSNMKELSQFDINYRIYKNNNGEIHSYMQPIGFTREQKQKNNKIKNIIVKTKLITKNVNHQRSDTAKSKSKEKVILPVLSQKLLNTNYSSNKITSRIKRKINI